MLLLLWRTQFRRNPRERIRDPYLLDLSSVRTYLLMSNSNRNMVLDLSSRAGYRLDTDTDPCLILIPSSALET